MKTVDLNEEKCSYRLIGQEAMQELVIRAKTVPLKQSISKKLTGV